MKAVKIVVERHSDTYVAYPLGIKGVVVGQGETYDDAVADLESAIRFHLSVFGDGTSTPMTIPNHQTLKSSTLRTILTQAGIPRDAFLRVYDET